MLICMIKVSAVNTEAEALDMSENLLDMAEEVTSMSDRYLSTKKIKTLGSKMTHFRKRCVRKGWQAPLDKIQEAFAMLQEAEQEAENFTNLLFKAR